MGQEKAETVYQEVCSGRVVERLGSILWGMVIRESEEGLCFIFFSIKQNRACFQDHKKSTSPKDTREREDSSTKVGSQEVGALE